MDVRDPAGPAVEQARAPYSSAVRSGQARATRRAIVSAAGELFVDQGYAATTIDAIAARAGVGRKTVFSSVGGKGALLKLVWDWAIAGDDEPVPMSERPAVRAIIAEREPDRLVRMWVEMLLDVGSRATPIGAVVLAAADVDTEARALSESIRRESLAGATAFVSHLADTGGLRADVSVERAADACWALVNSLLLHLLVAGRGWSMHEYGEWLTRLASATLLEPRRPAGEPPTDWEVRTVRDSAHDRYEARVDGRVAGHLSYQRTERFVVLTNTSVAPGFEDRGVADALVRAALDDLRAAHEPVVALCHFVAWWIGQHPDYAPLLHDTTAD